MLAAFVAAVFLSASLLFLIQPMAARLLVPLLGGSPAVWNTSMVFFQAVLLAGYLYAHLLTRRLAPRTQAVVHAAVLVVPLLAYAALGRLPVLDPRELPTPDTAHPTAWVLLALLLSVGVPFFVLSTTGPLLQRWFASTTHRHARDPYFLYAASNLGSMLALLAYPFAMERTLRLAEQRAWFSAGYVAFAALAAVCGMFMLSRLPREPASRQDRRRLREHDGGSPAHAPLAPISLGTRLRWIALAAVPSSLMLGVTQHVSSDIAAVPLLWVIPLAIYLLTFIAAFSGRGVPTRSMTLAYGVTAILVAVALLGRMSRPVPAVIAMHMLVLFLGGLVCHGRLASERPDPRRLTEYFLLIAVGGVIGGTFNALLAPVLFNAIAEYPIAITAACLLGVPGFGDGGADPRRSLTHAGAVREGVYAVLAVLAWTVVFAWALGGAGSEAGFWTIEVFATGALAAFLMWRGVKVPATLDLAAPLAVLLFIAGLHVAFRHAWLGGHLLSALLGEATPPVRVPLVLGSWLGPILVLVAAGAVAARVAAPRSRMLARAIDLLVPAMIAGLFYFTAYAMRQAGLTGGSMREFAWYGPIALLLLLSLGRRLRLALGVGVTLALFYSYAGAVDTSLSTTRTFFGVHRIATDTRRQWVLLSHGTTRHGVQSTDPDKAMIPTMYYHRTGPIGEVFRTRENDPGFDQVAIIGLGTGGLSAYGRTGQTITYYEIDPEVVRIARDSGYFTYLKRTPAEVKIVLGDGRIRLRQAPDRLYDLIIVDAFSSDSIPIHLVTKEAVREYFDKLAPGGVIAFHVSNRYLELRPILAGIATDLDAEPGMEVRAITRDDTATGFTDAEKAEGKEATTWVLLARRLEDFRGLADGERWIIMGAAPETPRWTDDFSNILSVFRW